MSASSLPAIGDPRVQRLTSLDALRGFIMVMLGSSVFGLHRVAVNIGESGIWPLVKFHTEHAAWETNMGWIGVSFWDLIQPFFMFMVGVSLPYSYAARKRRGQSDSQVLLHTLWRSLALVMLGVFLASTGSSQTRFVFTNVLAQIGLGYTFLFLLVRARPVIQASTIGVILTGYWLFFFLHGGSDGLVLPESASHVMEAPFQQWSKNVNAAADVDRWFLNQFPRPGDERFSFNGGGYHTLNFIPSLATMILGLMAGQLLMSRRDDRKKLVWLMAGGAVCLLLGVLSGMFVCPIVKRIWTPSWTLFSGAWVLWTLALFYLVFDVARLRRIAFPLVVVGMNPLAMYMMGQLLRGWLIRNLTIHGGGITSGVAGGLGMSEMTRGQFMPLWQYTAAFIVMWLVCYGMYRRKIFLRI